jgi:hypothetical protein
MQVEPSRHHNVRHERGALFQGRIGSTRNQDLLYKDPKMELPDFLGRNDDFDGVVPGSAWLKGR